MSRPRIYVKLLMLFTALSLLLSGCGKPAPKVPEGGLRLMVPATKSESRIWQDAIDTFTDATKIRVALHVVPRKDYETTLSKALNSRRPPDVAVVRSTQLPELATGGKLLGLNAYAAKEKDFSPKDYYPVAWEAFQYQGECLALPHEINIISAIYNQEHLEAKMLSQPKSSWTWDDYLELAQNLTTDTNEDGRPEIFGASACPWWQILVWQYGGDIVDDPTNPRKSTLGSPEAKEALQWLADLYLKHRVVPSPELAQAEEQKILFASERISIAIIPRWDLKYITDQSRFPWIQIELPHGKVEANLGSGSGFCIAKAVAEPDKAWKLAYHLSAGPGQVNLLNGGFSCPAFIALAESESFGGGEGQTGNVFYSGLKVAHPLPYTPHYADIAAIWARELPALWSGRETVDVVTARIDEQVNRILEQTQPATAWFGTLLPKS